MFFPEKICSIKPLYKVLEVGPGGTPHPRATVLLDYAFPEEEAFRQRGNIPKPQFAQPIVYYTGNNFPFQDQSFDYVICSHVLEHIPLDNIPFFINELTRVAPRGFIEFPNGVYELMCNAPAHRSLMALHEDTIVFLDKSRVNSLLENPLVHAWRELFYTTTINNVHLFDMIYQNYRDIFFNAFEWHGDIKHKMTTDMSDIIKNSQIKNFPKPTFTNFSKKSVTCQLKEKLQKKYPVLFKLANVFFTLCKYPLK